MKNVITERLIILSIYTVIEHDKRTAYERRKRREKFFFDNLNLKTHNDEKKPDIFITSRLSISSLTDVCKKWQR